MYKLVVLFVLGISTLLGEPIVLITLPKSGTVYIVNTLKETTQKPFKQISPNTFPKAPIDPSCFLSLVSNCGITVEHCDPSPHNIQLLRRHWAKLVIHVRDPRQAMLSALHMIRSMHRPTESFLFSFPEGFFEWEFDKQLDWMVDNYLPACVDWIQGWLTESEKNVLDIKFTTFEEFKSDQQAFFEDILVFCNLDKYTSSIPTLPQKRAYHFRKGLTDEWREVLSLEQQIRATDQIPRDFFVRFNWTP